MNVITIESEAYQELIEKIESISEHLQKNNLSINPDEAWVDSDDVCRYLKISPRSLSRLRTMGRITYSTIGGKTYYTISEIHRILDNRMVRSEVESVDELSNAYKKRLESIHKKDK